MKPNRKAIIDGYVEVFNRDDEETVRQAVDNAHAAAFLEENIPLFLCPDPELEKTYYFRWWTFRKHIKETEFGRILTEFHPPVGWAGPCNSIICATGHHLAEGRWLACGKELLAEYLAFWMEDHGDITAYSTWIADAALKDAYTFGDPDFAVKHLDDFDRFYRRVEDTNMTRYGLFWSYDDRDGMEYQISGSGLRTTINAYMIANAEAIAEMAASVGRDDLAETYAKKAEELKRNLQTMLWDKKDGFYKTIPQVKPSDEIPSFDFAEIAPEHNVREEIGYIPWMFGLALPEQEGAWKYLTDPAVFKAPFGPRTADGSHPLYRKNPVDHECLWDGPSWPFATTETADALIRYLQDGGTALGAEDFMDLLTTYSASHRLTREDGSVVPWIDEDLDAETGEWIARTILKDKGWQPSMGGYERGKDYNHSAFCDLVIRGIGGIIPEKGNTVRFAPLVPEDMWDAFLVEDIPYHGTKLTVSWDRDGSRYGYGAGYSIWCGGECLGKRSDLGELTVELPAK